MAIGDAVAVFLGTGAVTRQPSSGVEEKITAVQKDASSGDGIETYDGSDGIFILRNDVRNDQDRSEVAQRFGGDYNVAFMITNTLYLRKPGTTSIIGIFGVQTNA